MLAMRDDARRLFLINARAGQDDGDSGVLVAVEVRHIPKISSRLPNRLISLDKLYKYGRVFGSFERDSIYLSFIRWSEHERLELQLESSFFQRHNASDLDRQGLLGLRLRGGVLTSTFASFHLSSTSFDSFTSLSAFDSGRMHGLCRGRQLPRRPWPSYRPGDGITGGMAGCPSGSLLRLRRGTRSDKTGQGPLGLVLVVAAPGKSSRL